MKREKIIVDYPESLQLLEESHKREREIENIAYDLFNNSKEKAQKAVNQLLYETAEKLKCSLYELCYRVYPSVEYEPLISIEHKGFVDTHTINMHIRLVPMDFNLTQGPGYWKKKYYNLKKQIQELLDKKEDEK